MQVRPERKKSTVVSYNDIVLGRIADMVKQLNIEITDITEQLDASEHKKGSQWYRRAWDARACRKVLRAKLTYGYDARQKRRQAYSEYEERELRRQEDMAQAKAKRERQLTQDKIHIEVLRQCIEANMSEQAAQSIFTYAGRETKRRMELVGA